MTLTSDILVIIAIIVVVALLIIGLIKKTLWMCVVAIVIATVFFITQPNKLNDFKESVASIFDNSIEPLKGEDYSDLIGAATGTIPKKIIIN